MRKIVLTFLTVVTVCLWSSCTECDPISNPVTSANVTFYRKNSAGTGYEKYKKLVFASVNGIYERFQGDTLLATIVALDDTLLNSRVYLPLRYDADSSYFRFLLADLNTANAETLQIYHAKKLVINAPDCGFYEQYSEIEVKGSFFDSVNVLNPLLVTDTTVVNIEVFVNDSIPGNIE